MSLVVSLDVLPADVPAEYAPAMISACSDALADGRCAMASTLPESEQPEAIALVLWQRDGFLQVTVRVGRGGGQWLARALTFSERDSISERWTTVGLTVATLVGETRALDGKGPASEPEVSTPPVADATEPKPAPLTSGTANPALPARPRARAAPSPTPWRGHVGVVTGPGWDAGGWRVGGWVSIGYLIESTPIVLHSIGSYALSDGPTVLGSTLTTRWATVGVGAGVTGTLHSVGVAGSAALEVAWRRIDVDFRGQGASDEEVPVSVRGLASFPAEGPLAATGGVVVRLPPGNTSESSGLRVGGPAFSAEVVAGLEVRL